MTRERGSLVVDAVTAAPTSSSSMSLGCCPICFDEYEEFDDPEDNYEGDEYEIDLDLALTSPTRFGRAAEDEDIETGGVVVNVVALRASLSDDDEPNDNIECSFSSDAKRDDDSEKRRDRKRRRPRKRRNRHRHRRVELDPCRHHYCSDCLEAYFAHSIQVRYVPIPCPSAGSDNDCQSTVALTSVLDVLGGGHGTRGTRQEDNDNGTSDSGNEVDEPTSSSRRQDLMRKLVKLHRLHDEPNLRCCPHCDELLVEGASAGAGAAVGAASAGEASSSSSSSSSPPGASLTNEDDEEHGVETALCPSCGRGLDVRGPTSPDGKSSHHEELRATEEWIAKSTKPCSHCRAPIHKDSGCDHVVCPNCHDDMCYNCGSHVHLTGRTIRTCTYCRRSYVDHRHNREYRCRLLLLLPLMVPGWILYVLTMTILAVLTFCFCGCFLCGTMESNPHLLEDGILREPDDDEKDGEGATDAAVIRFTDSTLTAATAATYQSASGPHHPNTDKTTTSPPPSSPSSPSSPSVAPLAPLLGIRRTIGYIGLPVLVYLGDLGVGGCTRWVEELETTSATVMEATAASPSATSTPVGGRAFDLP